MTSASQHLVLRVRGDVSARDAAELAYRVADVSVADAHDSVVCDVSSVGLIEREAARRVAGLLTAEPGPGPAIYLVGARGVLREALAGLAPEQRSRAVGSMAEVLAASRLTEPRLCAVRSMVPGASAPRLARRFVRETCAGWGLGETEDAELVADELVTNAVTHAGTGAVVRLELTTEQLVVAVRDGAADAFPVWWHGGDEEGKREWGRGLTLVRALSERAGVRAEPGGGKTVWAVLRTAGAGGAARPPRRMRLLVNSGRGLREDARWEVHLDLVWQPERPELVRLLLTSRPRHPSLPRGSWLVAVSTLRDALDEPVREGELRIRPERAGRQLVLQVPADPVQVVRVSAPRVRHFLEQLA